MEKSTHVSYAVYFTQNTHFWKVVATKPFYMGVKMKEVEKLNEERNEYKLRVSVGVWEIESEIFTSVVLGGPEGIRTPYPIAASDVL